MDDSVLQACCPQGFMCDRSRGIAEPLLKPNLSPFLCLAEQHRLHVQQDSCSPVNRSLLADVLNISNVVTDGAAAMVEDSFNKCFISAKPDPWNWNFYLWFCWGLGVLIRWVFAGKRDPCFRLFHHSLCHRCCRAHHDSVV